MSPPALTPHATTIRLCNFYLFFLHSPAEVRRLKTITCTAKQHRHSHLISRRLYVLLPTCACVRFTYYRSIVLASHELSRKQNVHSHTHTNSCHVHLRSTDTSSTAHWKRIKCTTKNSHTLKRCCRCRRHRGRMHMVVCDAYKRTVFAVLFAHSLSLYQRH